MIGGVTTQAPAQVLPRRATEQDVAALVHLRSLMFSSMGFDVGGQDAAWRVAAADWLREQLTMPQQFAGFVMEHPADGVVCAALGSCDARAPSPNDVSGSHGHVFNICTEPAHRRSGYGQACLGALHAWFQTDTGVASSTSVPPPGAPTCTGQRASGNRRFPRCGCNWIGSLRVDDPGYRSACDTAEGDRPPYPRQLDCFVCRSGFGTADGQQKYDRICSICA